MGREQLEWSAYEYEYKEKKSDWFWAVSIIAGSIAITSIILENVLFALLIILSAFTIMLFANRKPQKIKCGLDRKGVVLAKNFYPYSTLTSFWIDEEEDEPKLLIKSERITAPLIVIPLSDEIHPKEIKTFISEFLHEEELNEPFSQKLMEYLGF